MTIDCLPASEIISDCGPQIEDRWFYGWIDTHHCRNGDLPAWFIQRMWDWMYRARSIDCLPASEVISQTPWWLFFDFHPSAIRTDTSRVSCGLDPPNWGRPSYWTRRSQRKFMTHRIDCTA